MTEPQERKDKIDHHSILDSLADWIRSYSQDDCAIVYEEGVEDVVRSFCEIEGIERFLRLQTPPKEWLQATQMPDPDDTKDHR